MVVLYRVHVRWRDGRMTRDMVVTTEWSEVNALIYNLDQNRHQAPFDEIDVNVTRRSDAE